MGKRILVADDSLTIQKAFAMVLSGQDYTLVPARSVDEALAAAKGGRLDLVIADVMLGNGSGYDLCASIKADPSLRGVPVHILASSQNPLDEARARRAGADGHLIKPFDSQALLDSLVAALAAPARMAPAPFAEVASLAPIAPVEQGNLTDELRVEEQADQDDDNYGEFTIEHGSSAGPPSWSGRPPTWPGARQAPVASPPPVVSPATRPSLIPGISQPPAASPAWPASPLPGVIPPPVAGSTARPAANRTIFGFPAAVPPPQTPQAPPPAAARPAVARPSGTQPIVAPRPAAPVAAPPPVASAPVVTPPLPVPPVSVPQTPVAPPAPIAAAPVAPARAPVIPARAPTPAPPTVPAVPAPLRRSASMPVAAPPPTPGPLVAAVSSVIDQKVAAIAARGREYEAIAKLSREIIEQVVWEVVPELAEVIIKQEIDRLVASKR